MEEKIGGYVVERLIGAGGMGMVYLAKHETLHRKAAVKVLMENLSTNPQIRERFIQEAKLMAGLDHQNIVTLYDFTIEPKLSLIMEFIDGRGLDQMIGQEVGPIPWEKALPLFTQILDGVGYAHSKGIIHRDIKPANILISKEGKVKITDLGIAKIAGQQGMTRTGAQMGTLYYESPEQIQGARDVDHRSDIYSLGMTLFEMLAGRLPFDTTGNTSEFAIMSSVVHRKAHLDPRDYYPHVPEWLVQMVQKATELDPAMRFQSCEDFKQEIIKSGNLSGTESGFWSGRVASTPSIPLVATKTVLADNSVNELSEGHCPKCGTHADKETEFCSSCGHNLMKNCPNCQFSFPWFTKFCPSCGVDVENPGPSTYSGQRHESAQHNIQPPLPPPKASSSKALWIIIPAAIVVFVGIIAAIAIPKFSDVGESAKQNACRANMRTLATQNTIYFAQNNEYSDNLNDLGFAGLCCPEGGSYRMTGDRNEYSITCPNGHGSIDDGLASWAQSY